MYYEICTIKYLYVYMRIIFIRLIVNYRYIWDNVLGYILLIVGIYWWETMNEDNQDNEDNEDNIMEVIRMLTQCDTFGGQSIHIYIIYINNQWIYYEDILWYYDMIWATYIYIYICVCTITIASMISHMCIYIYCVCIIYVNIPWT